MFDGTLTERKDGTLPAGQEISPSQESSTKDTDSVAWYSPTPARRFQTTRRSRCGTRKSKTTFWNHGTTPEGTVNDLACGLPPMLPKHGNRGKVLRKAQGLECATGPISLRPESAQRPSRLHGKGLCTSWLQQQRWSEA